MELFKMVMDQATSLVYVKDETSRFVYANNALLELFDKECRSLVIGATMAEYFAEHEANKFISEDRIALETGSSEIIEDIVDFTGKRRVFRTRKKRFYTDDGEKRLLGISEDITSLVERERELVATNHNLKAISSMIAHDLRSPLASYIMALDFIRNDKNSNLSKNALQSINLISAGASRLAENINVLLSLAKFDHNPMEFKRESFDLNLLLTEVKFALSGLIDATNTKIYSDRLPTIHCVCSMLRALFQNLIENSIKYKKSHVDCVITIRHLASGNKVIFLFEDNGRGIPSGECDRVFEPFEQAAAHGGVGLGLSLCRKTVELHDGTIWVDRAFTDGTRVIIEIPLAGQKTLVEKSSAIEKYQTNELRPLPVPLAS